MAAICALEDALDALEPDSLRTLMDQFLEQGIEKLQRVLHVTAIMGQIKDELEEVVK